MIGVVLAGETAEEAAIPFDQLGLLTASEQALADASMLVAGVIELRERLHAGLLGPAARSELATDLYNLSAKVQAFTLGVF